MHSEWQIGPHNRASFIFLKQQASRHFVFLTYYARLSNERHDQRRHFSISCFVVDISGFWMLITAGHVITELKQQLDAGVIFSDWCLHDEMAGHDFPFGVPIAFDLESWIVAHVDSQGFDYAAMGIDPLTAAQLHSGNIIPIDESVWGPVPIEEMKDWLLVGIPADSESTQPGGPVSLKVTLLPLYQCPPPEDVVDPPSENKFYGRVREALLQGEPHVENIEGMSGGPVFGTKSIDGITLKYWVIGIQSGWYRRSRIASFCPLAPFLLHLKDLLAETV